MERKVNSFLNSLHFLTTRPSPLIGDLASQPALLASASVAIAIPLCGEIGLSEQRFPPPSVAAPVPVVRVYCIPSPITFPSFGIVYRELISV